MMVVHRFGRKPLLVFSGSAMTICLGILGYYYKMKEDNQDITWISWLPLTCIGMFNVVFSLGYGSVPYSIISELFPPETKGIAGSISIMTNWFLVFLVTRTFHILTRMLHESVTFWLFASVCAMSALFAFVYVPETKGKSLQEIQTKLARRKKDRGRKHEAVEPKPLPLAPA
jgi:nitrate/nitrite transporter NarK